MSIITKVAIDDDVIARKLNSLKDEDTMLQIHNEFARMCDPYVPMRSGTLAQTTEITSKSVRYTSPYAHYQYTGLVYGPNIPIMENGVIVGWFSLPDRPKTPTGEHLNYSTEMHPLATKEWDKAMMRDKGDEFKKQVTEILRNKLARGDNG